jgi:hypothetical protein
LLHGGGLLASHHETAGNGPPMPLPPLLQTSVARTFRIADPRSMLS